MNRTRVCASILGAAALVALGGRADAENIATVEAQPSGTAVTIDSNPVVTTILSQVGTFNGKTYSSNAFLANDGTGSVEVFGATAPYTPAVGDVLGISGVYSPFDSIPEVEKSGSVPLSVTQLSTGNPVPAPLVESVATLDVASPGPSLLGYPITVDNVTLSGATGSFGITNITFTATDSTGSMEFYYWPTSYAEPNINNFGNAIPTGPVNVTGFLSVFGTTPQLNIISIAAVPEPTSFCLLALGSAALAWQGLRRRQRAASKLVAA